VVRAALQAYLPQPEEGQALSAFELGVDLFDRHAGACRPSAPVGGSVSEVLRISERFASLPVDLVAASMAEAAARLELRRVLSIDADFGVCRDRDRAGKPLLNLLQR